MPMACGGGRDSAHGRGEPRTGSVRHGRLKLVRVTLQMWSVVMIQPAGRSGVDRFEVLAPRQPMTRRFRDFIG